ncbi:RtcB family protein [Phyllobacterium myrsinacearum]|uniref:RtcB family protein n=1 Tax=Phyllobacterium myrsinacearum TaxID=28101 RepID=UPI003D7E5A37
MDGFKLISWGFPTGKWFGSALEEAQNMERLGASEQEIFDALKDHVPVEIGMRTNSIPYSVFLEPENDEERANLASVNAHMDALLRVPTIVSGAIMPDACPAGSQLGTIPVGGVVATKDAIHPGFHSADICCSMFMTVFNRQDDLKRILDIAMKVTHFGPGGREDFNMSPALHAQFDQNHFLKGLNNIGDYAMGTQGDGNHFLYVGTLESTGQPAIVTHHGSRNVGAQLYKRGMAAAKRHTSIVAPRIPSHNAWIDANSADGESYWEALQIVREWTKANHAIIHDTIARILGNKVVGQMWNEHNFVFRRTDGLFYHGKGATPSFKGFAADETGRTLIPLNMSEPILIAEPTDKKEALGFAPHGAGRNTGRKNYLRGLAAKFGDPEGLSPIMEKAIFEDQTEGLDIRSYSGTPDLSELPGAYKNAAAVTQQIHKFGLANLVDSVIPYGSIMAGEQKWDRGRK